MYDGFHKILEVRDKIKGKDVVRELVKFKDAVGAIMVDDKNRICLVTQYRPTIQKHVKEIPAGLLDKHGLTSIETLLEELKEECELNAEDLLYLGKDPVHEYHFNIGSSDAKIQLYFIKVKNSITYKTVDDADVEYVEWIPFDDFEQMMIRGEIYDTKTIIAYYWLKNNLKMMEEY